MRNQFSTLVDDDEEPTLTPPRAKLPSEPETTLVARSPSADDRRLVEMRARLAEKDHDSALILAEAVLAGDPNHLEAKECRLRSETALEDACVALLGPLTQVPQLVVSMDEVCALSLDNRLGFLLSRIDGTSSVEAILCVSSMTRLDSIRALLHLLKKGVVTLT